MTRSSDYISGNLYFPFIIFFQDVYFIGREARQYQRCANSVVHMHVQVPIIIVVHATYTLCGWS